MKLSEAFKVPAKVLGYLEWASGILFVNATYDEFKGATSGSLGQPLTPRQRYLLQTITHESYHFAQVVTTGFFFRFACQALKCVSGILRPPLDADRVESLLATPPPMSEEYIDLVATLDAHSGDNLTNRAVIESSTIFFEHREHLRGLDHDSYLKLLRVRIPLRSSEYRIAYEIATDVLGPQAFDAFLPVSFIALCFDSPPDAFRGALTALRRNGSPREWTLRIVQQVFESIGSSHRPLGSAVEVMETGLNHPIYSAVVMALNDNSGKVSPIEMMIRPDRNTLDYYLPIVRPTLFRKGVLHIPKAFSDRYPQSSASEVISAIAILGALSMRIGFDESFSKYRVIAEEGYEDDGNNKNPSTT